MFPQTDCLYVSDLDGTLLHSDERISDYTNDVINRLTAQGMLFSYATARSLVTAKKVTRGMDAQIPLIVYNGTFVFDNRTEEILIANYFGADVLPLLEELFAAGIHPIVYAFVDGAEKFSFIPAKTTRGMKTFLATRAGDRRERMVDTTEELIKGNIFYLTCIDEPEKLEPFWHTYRDRYHCVFQKDLYSGEQWLEIMPAAASKSNAVRQLKELLHCKKVVAFGDGVNDIDMFELADESYAVANAAPELKQHATGIIGSNDEDGVAHWLSEHF